MPDAVRHFYDFDRFQIDVAERVLLSDGEIIPLTQKSFDVLLALVERHGQIVEKEELLRQVWPDTFVEEGNLSQNIYTLRKVLGQTLAGQEFIKTVPKRGYRFVPNVREQQVREAALSAEDSFAEQKFPDVDSDHNSSVELSSVREISEVIPQPASPNNQPASWISRHKKLAAVLATTLLIGSLSGLLWLANSLQGSLFSTNSAGRMVITNLTTTGNLACAAISADGKYVAYGLIDSPQRGSLWLTQIATLANRQVVPPTEIQYHALTFSRDGQFIYFVTRETNLPRMLYQVSVLGGPPKKLLEKVDSAVSFSPDGTQFVFRRVINERRETALFIANADGSGEQEITSKRIPENLGDPSWSPDGKLIACSAGNHNGQADMYAVSVRVEDGSLKPMMAKRWRWIGQMDWLADSSGLMMVAGEHTSSPYQVWRLNSQNGEAIPITNDSNFYNRLSLAADSGILVALQRRQVTNVWMIPRDAAGNARQITFGAGGYRGPVSWMPDGRLLYDSEAANSPAISTMNPDGSLQTPVASELVRRSYVGQPVVSPDGRYIVFTSDFKGPKNIWRMDLDGSNPIQLTAGEGEDSPSCTPDGRWVVYTKLEHKGVDRPTLWRVSMDGGQPTQLTTDFTDSAAVSADGKQIACLYSVPNQSWQLAIYPVEGGPPIQVFPQQIQSAFAVRWTPDGRGLTYAENPIGPARLWIQPVEGGEPKLLAEFASDRIFGFDWSRDGTQLACVRGIWATNTVLIKGFN
ncbi:MAG: winged helix-turn-helix domain-containing protein [Acidobacteriota bacterium]